MEFLRGHGVQRSRRGDLLPRQARRARRQDRQRTGLRPFSSPPPSGRGGPPSCRRMNGNPMTLIQFPPLNAARLNARVEALSRITRPEAPWTRRAFSPLFMEARAWLREEFAAAGLEVRQDAGGNLIGRRPGDGRRGRPIITGSHCDTVVGGGRFDGIIGVLAGVEVAHTLHEHNIALAHPFEVIDFLSEEPSDYGISCVGSRAFSGRLEAAMLAAKNADGESLGEALRRM